MTRWPLNLVALISTLISTLALAGCAKRVDQHASTGPDGFYDGAERVELDAGGAGDAEGRVSYPGGDRNDWKSIQLPAGRVGDLELELEWSSPRDGIDLALVIYDEFGTILGEAEPETRRRNKRSGDKSLTLEKAKGLIYVLVYASLRGDAGDYELAVKFVDKTPPPPVTLDSVLARMLAEGLVIPQPPRIHSVYPRCGSDYDDSNPDCVENPPACDRDNRDKKNPSCKKLCDENKLDPKNPDCKQFYPACDTSSAAVFDSKNPNCKDQVVVKVPPPPPIKVEVINVKIKDDKTFVTVTIGADSPIKSGWQGKLLDPEGLPVARGEFIVNVAGKYATGSVALSRDVAQNYTQAEIYYPDDYVAPAP